MQTLFSRAAGTFGLALVPAIVPVLCSTARAANTSSASAHLGALSVVLTDLDPADGIEPSITWGQTAWWQYERDAYVVSDGTFAYDAGYPGNWGTLSPDLSATLPGLSATHLGDFGAQDTSASFTEGPTQRGGLALTSFYLDPQRRSNSPTDYFGDYFTFELSANTRVTFSAEASVSAQTYAASGSGVSSAQAVASISAGDITATDTEYSPYFFTSQGSGIESGRDQISVAVYDYPSSSLSASDAGTLSIAYSNLTSTPQAAYFWSGTQASAQTAAVPEPAGAALLLAGSALWLTTKRPPRKRHCACKANG